MVKNGTVLEQNQVQEYYRFDVAAKQSKIVRTSSYIRI